MDFPKILQIEPTNHCNFSCIMCMRNFFKTDLRHMNTDLYKKILKESIGRIEKLDLYGQGEPLVNPNFIKMVRLAREKLGSNVELFLSTNGSLLTSKIANKLLIDLKVNDISFSVDTTDFAKLEKIRLGASSQIIFNNLRYVADLKKINELDFKLGIEVVVMKSNIKDLPDLVRNMGEIGVDYIVVSQIIPYTHEYSKDLIYLTTSREIIELIGDINSLDWEIVRRAVYESYSFIYGQSISRSNELSLREIWRKAGKLDLEVNLPLLIENKDLVRLIHQGEESFREAAKIAKKYSIDLDLPEIFPRSKDRKCPYVEKEAMVIRSDGKVVPCFNFIYTHLIFINNHYRTDYEVIFGDVNYESISEIWNSEKYVAFRKRLRDMQKNVPWCGDCPYSPLGCWFTRNNKMDCYGNEYSCSECLYSANIAKCII